MDIIHIKNIAFYESDFISCSNHAEYNTIIKIKNKHILKFCKIIIIKKSGDLLNTHTLFDNHDPCEKCKKILNKYKLNILKYKTYL